MAKIKIFALGGLGENGKNMYVVEVNQHIFILDAGIKYPDIDMYGVDAVIPNINYLIKNKDRIEGIFITHGLNIIQNLCGLGRSMVVDNLFKDLL